MKWTFDLKPEDVFWCTADVGWVTGHTYVAYGPLACGATQIVFEGVPTYPNAGRFWEMIDRHKCTIFYTAPTAIRSLVKAGETSPDHHPKKYDLSSLRRAGRDDASLGAALRRRLPPGRPAAGGRQHRDRTRARRDGAGHPPGVDKVAFTGSTEIGKRIAKGVAGTDKGLTLELGGKAANIVFDDAPLDQAVEGIVNGIYFNQGEVCCAGSRLLAQESIVDPLIEKLKDRLSTIRVGDPLDKNTDVGAINSKSQLEKITELVASGVAEGADLYQPACDLPDRGYFFRPTLFTNVAQSHRIAREEIFGPVLSVLTFRTPDEADREGQQHGLRPVGRDLDRQGLAHPRDGAALKAGVVWANTFNQFDPTSPFGGYKESGLRARGRHARPPRLRPARGPLMATRAHKASTPARTGTTRAAATRARTRPWPPRRPASTCARPTSCTSAARSRGPSPGARTSSPPPTATLARQRLPRVAQGRPRRGPGRAQGIRGLGRQDRDEPRPGPLPRRGADGGPPRAVRRRGRGGRGVCARPPRAPSSTAPSIAGSGTPAGPTRSPRSSARPTRSLRRTSTSRSPSRPASSASSRRRPRRCSVSSAGSRRRSSPAMPWSCSPASGGRFPR